MLVIHIISTEDTTQFSNIYQNLDARVLINPSSSEARHVIIEELDTIILIGLRIYNERFKNAHVL